MNFAGYPYLIFLLRYMDTLFDMQVRYSESFYLHSGLSRWRIKNIFVSIRRNIEKLCTMLPFIQYIIIRKWGYHGKVSLSSPLTFFRQNIPVIGQIKVLFLFFTSQAYFHGITCHITLELSVAEIKNFASPKPKSQICELRCYFGNHVFLVQPC